MRAIEARELTEKCNQKISDELIANIETAAKAGKNFIKVQFHIDYTLVLILEENGYNVKLTGDSDNEITTIRW